MAAVPWACLRFGLNAEDIGLNGRHESAIARFAGDLQEFLRGARGFRAFFNQSHDRSLQRCSWRGYSQIACTRSPEWLGATACLFSIRRIPMAHWQIGISIVVSSMLASGTALAQGADSCSSAQRVKGYGVHAFDSSTATTDGLPDGLCNFFSNQQIFNDVWFAFTAPETFVVEISTCAQTSLDSKIAIYQGLDCAAPVIACSDDNCSLQTKVTLAMTAGQSYLIRLGGYGATDFGTGTLTIAPIALLADLTNKVTGIRYAAVAGTTWSASESLANALGGHLVSINDAEEQDFVAANFGNLGGVDRRLWIGYTDRDSEGFFQWSDGTTSKYSNWNGGEPNNSGNVEDYAEMLGSNGRWNDLNDAGAGFAHIAVMELPTVGGPDPCPADFDGDGFVTAADLSGLLANWGDASAGVDINGDGFVDAADLSLLLAAWGACP
jgi:hypothetical protein